MDQKFKIDIPRIWRALVAEMALKYRLLVRALLLPAAVMVIADMVMVEFTGAVNWTFTAIYGLFAAMFAVSTHRVVLLSPESLSNPWGIYVDRYVLRYLGYSLLIGFAMFFLIIGSGLFTVLLGAVLPGVAVALLMAALWVALIYLMVRLGMVLPAQAIGDRFDLVEMFRATAGHGWRLVFATGLPVLGVAILLYPLSLVTESVPLWLAALPMVLNVLLTGMIGAAVLSCSYRELKQSPDFPPAPSQ